MELINIIDPGRNMEKFQKKDELTKELAQPLEAQQSALEKAITSQRQVIEEELGRLLETFHTATSEAKVREEQLSLKCKELNDTLIAAIAEKERLSAINQAQLRFLQLESQNTWHNRVGQLLAQSIDSPFSSVRLPFKLHKLWKETKKQRPPKVLGGESFNELFASYKSGGFDAADMLLTNAIVSPMVKANGYTALSQHLKIIDPREACKAAYRAYEEDPRPYRRKWLAFRLCEAGDVLGADILLDALPAEVTFSTSENNLKQKIRKLAQNERKFSAQRQLEHHFKPPENQSIDIIEKIQDIIHAADLSSPLTATSPQIFNGSTDEKKLRVACIMDDFTFLSYAPECQLSPLTPKDAIKELEEFRPELLFVESAWRGKDDLWKQKVGYLGQELRDALMWCKERRVPTVFWNKEDPIHFETFLNAAQQFDFVFTTDIDCIARYKTVLGHERVYLLPFACQPKLNNPIERYCRKDAFCFAGAYYLRYPERTADLENYVVELTKFKPLEIFDRNLGKDDVNYKFPEKYKPFIVGNLPFHEIDKAYKGYKYAINLNSIKQSQTMFARRIYELLGSNTLIISNFSRGLRLLFGDIIISSDSGKEIVSRLQSLDEDSMQKVRLAGLRKVMLEHCYAHRMQYVLSKALNQPKTILTPALMVLALVGSREEYEHVLDNFQSQAYPYKRLLVILRNNIDQNKLVTFKDDNTVTTMDFASVMQSPLNSFTKRGEWLALMAPEDYYGPNYLLDIALTTQYSDIQLAGKAAQYQWTANGIYLLDQELTYCPVEKLLIRCSAIHSNALSPDLTISSLFQKNDYLQKEWNIPGISIDVFNYCRYGKQGKDLENVKTRVDDLSFDAGISFDDFLKETENIKPMPEEKVNIPKWDAEYLYNLLGNVNRPQVHLEISNGELSIFSTLPDGSHDYIYANQDIPQEHIKTENTIKSYLDTSPGVNIQYVFIYLDKNKNRIHHTIHQTNKNCTITVPEETAFVRFGLRIYSGGRAVIKGLFLDHRILEPPLMLTRNNIMLLTNHYPSYDNLYRNGFVHSRVRAYKKRGVNVDIFRFRSGETLSYYEFKNVDVTTGGASALEKLLSTGGSFNILVHFLTPAMWEVLQHYPQVRITVWLHGSEVQPWYRRDFNYQNEQEREKAKLESDQRIAFWRHILNPIPSNLRFVFVSQYFAEEVMGDVGIRIPDNMYSVIHNPIDTSLFSYEPKSIEQRKRILSIRPYASRKYANDLSVKAILHLSTRPCFQEMEFRMIGDGRLFDETLEPLKKFSNVFLEQRFLTQEEIAYLHKNYGVFLSPTRMDAQGVSRDEAMASGMVPITNAVTAIPEFVDDSCGFLAAAEDALGLASAIEQLYDNPTLFTQLSSAAAGRVRRQSDAEHIISKELELITQMQPSQGACLGG